MKTSLAVITRGCFPKTDRAVEVEYSIFLALNGIYGITIPKSILQILPLQPLHDVSSYFFWLLIWTPMRTINKGHLLTIWDYPRLFSRNQKLWSANCILRATNVKEGYIDNSPFWWQLTITFPLNVVFQSFVVALRTFE